MKRQADRSSSIAKGLSTQCVHGPQLKIHDDIAPSCFPIYQTAKFSTGSLERLVEIFEQESGHYIYSRASNPTVHHLEMHLAAICGQETALALASGCAAISSVLLAQVRAGDSIVMFYESYRPTRFLAESFLAKFQVKTHLLSVDEADKLDQLFEQHRPKICLMEIPTNPITRVVDVVAIAELCRKHQVTSVLDATFAAFHQLQDIAVDIIIHSLSKFAGGHGDIIAGAVLGDQSLVGPIRDLAIQLGPCLDPHTAFLIERGLKTFTLRYQRQVENAAQIADFLASHPSVDRVFYPFRKDHPDHDLARRILRDGGTIISCSLKGGKTALFDFCRALNLFKITGSLGSVDSLVAPVDLFYGGGLTTQQRVAAFITPGTFRLAIGIEDIGDLLADLKNALPSS